MNVNDYSIPQLLEFASINKKIEDVTKSEIKSGIDKRIIRSMQLQKPEYTHFFHAVKEKLFGFLELLHTEQELGEMENVPVEEHDDGWSEAYSQTIIPPKKDAKSRIESRKIVDEEHMIMDEAKLSPDLEASKMKYTRGEINKLFRQNIFYHLTINSQNRKLINISKNFSSESSANCDTLENLLPPNPKTYVEKENDFTISLSAPLKNVVKLRVTQIEIPISWYTFRMTNGTTSFKIGPSTPEGEKYYPIDVGASTIVHIPEGNYSEVTLIDTLQNQLSPHGYSIVYSEITKRVTISGPANFHLFFYLEKTPEISASSDNPVIPAVLGNIIDPSAAFCTKVYPKIDYNLGWLLGFRQSRYSGSNTYTAESILDVRGPRVICIEVNDFTNNAVSNYPVSIKEEGDQWGRPYGIEECEERKEEGIKYDAKLDFVGCRPPRNAEHPDKTASGDLIQATTKKQFWAKQQIKRLWNPIPNRTRPNLKTFVRLQVKKEMPDDVVLLVQDDSIAEREYFGPVTISRMNLKLISENGDALDLNGQQWSIHMVAEALYQF